MRVSIFDVEECRINAGASVPIMARADAVEACIQGSTQLYLRIRNKCGSHEYVVLKPGWAVAMSEPE